MNNQTITWSIKIYESSYTDEVYWIVTDEHKSFKAYTSDEATWLCDTLNALADLKVDEV